MISSTPLVWYMKRNDDGSLTIYRPKDSALTGAWKPPAAQRVQ